MKNWFITFQYKIFTIFSVIFSLLSASLYPFIENKIITVTFIFISSIFNIYCLLKDYDKKDVRVISTFLLFCNSIMYILVFISTTWVM